MTLTGGGDVLGGGTGNDVSTGDGALYSRLGTGRAELVGGDDTLAGGAGNDILEGDGAGLVFTAREAGHVPAATTSSSAAAATTR